MEPSVAHRDADTLGTAAYWQSVLTVLERDSAVALQFISGRSAQNPSSRWRAAGSLCALPSIPRKGRTPWGREGAVVGFPSHGRSLAPPFPGLRLVGVRARCFGPRVRSRPLVSTHEGPGFVVCLLVSYLFVVFFCGAGNECARGSVLCEGGDPALVM